MIGRFRRVWGGAAGRPPVARFYRLALLDENGTPLITRPFRVYRDLQPANEMQAQMVGRELARDAMHHAGWWEIPRP
ncbi:hypothetical protein [Bradyrhizobium ivorense]|uniref:hypothetical protein n=1 Tax=Bradyrhizobium ivorense TaxID=2511166 RepID=UPI0010B99BC2|nr:hypothetical protein [Bradyrhizobium ivorense]VIO73875.1 hypothetical protein CI41S_39840 [Bradyrhizobium ivorense]